MSAPLGIVITTRLGSQRVPEKPFVELGGRRAMDIQLAFLRRTELPIIAAIPEVSTEDPLAHAYYAAGGVLVYRGHDESPLHRLLAACMVHGYENVVRVTSDDLFVDASILMEQWEEHQRRHSDYTICAPVPHGGAAEIIRTSCLKRAVESVMNQPVEYASYPIRNATQDMFTYSPRPCYRHSYRLLLDWPEDVMALRIVVGALSREYRDEYDLYDIVRFMRAPQNWYVEKINRLPLVTVYTSCYNQCRYIRSAMESVLVQRPRFWEYLVYDDRSTDESASVMLDVYSQAPDDVRSRMHLYRNEENIGLPATCNRALARARGAYVVRLDSDDEMKDGALEVMVKSLKALDGVAALFAGYERIDDTGLILDVNTQNEEEHPGMCLLLKRAAHEVRYRDGLQRYEGVEFLARFKARYSVAHTASVTWRYRKHAASKSAGDTPESRAAAVEKIQRVAGPEPQP